jgi:nucleoside-diphosphate-sugar epimerase
MSKILLTGANGFLGKALLSELSQRHEVFTITRCGLPDAPNQFHVRGHFANSEDLRQFDNCSIDTVVHLAAVTGGCSETDGLRVNVEGTHALMRHFVDRGCRKFVIASSIAVVGIESPAFRPLQIPIPDEHPCLDRHGYGLSKFLMEEVTRYLHRQNPETDILNLRLAAVYPDDAPPPKVRLGEVYPWAVGSITLLSRSQAVRAFQLAAESPRKPRFRILNAVSQSAWVETSTSEVLRSWWGTEIDWEGLDDSSRPCASLFDASAIAAELGFEEMH